METQSFFQSEHSILPLTFVVFILIMELLPLVALAVYHRVKKSSLSRLVYLGFLVTVSRLIGLRRNITLFARTPTNFKSTCEEETLYPSE